MNLFTNIKKFLGFKPIHEPAKLIETLNESELFIEDIINESKIVKRPLSILNFYTRDGSDGQYREIAHLHWAFAWTPGCPYYGYEDGVPRKWNVYNEPVHLHRIDDINEAQKYAELIEFNKSNQTLNHHIDSAARIQAHMNRSS